MNERSPMSTGEMVFTGLTLLASFGFLAWIYNKEAKAREDALKRREAGLDRAEKVIAELRSLHIRGIIVDAADLPSGPNLKVLRDTDND